ncbi:PA14 domain-containing protein [Abditibacterium utsteinense]|uniref:PA14 domain-containing protein n=1 Tax=Abditibacterium utsteinense TaxID=1960156 RepID=UPI001472EC20|nr:PA14 domain-containing protein [Abditibacterium utsteinense]
MRPIPNTSKALVGTGTGLSATYYDNSDFTNPKLGRRDQRVDFNWGSVAPDPKMGAESFSVRWSGFVQAQFSENYTFSALSDDGVRLYIDNKLVINRWANQSATTSSSAKIALRAGVKVPIRLEYFDSVGDARAHLSWSSASTPKTLIPQSQLYVAAQPAKPIFSVPAGTYSGVQNVAITSATPGAMIRYTLDGSEPDLASSILPPGGALRFTYTQILRAAAFVSGQIPSEIASAHYIIPDTILPGLTITTPAPLLKVTALPPVAGTATDAGSGVSRVDLVLTRLSDGLRWNGTSWVARESGLSTTLAGDGWNLTTSLPRGANLPLGDYEIKAVAYDFAGLIRSQSQKTTVISVVDVSGPTLTISFPANGAVVSDLSGIAGTARDDLNAVAKVGVVIRRVSDGARWNG